MSVFGNDRGPNRTVEKIIRAHGEEPSYGTEDGANDPHRYTAILSTQGFPQMGFSIFTRGGQRHGFFYHNLDNLDFIDGKHGEYLRFTHRGKAVTLRGRGMHNAFDAIMEHTLQALYEYSEAWPAPSPDEDLIDRVEVTALPGAVGTT